MPRVRLKNAVIVNEKEAEIVRHIFSLAEKGMSSTQIAKELIAKQMPTVYTDASS